MSKRCWTWGCMVLTSAVLGSASGCGNTTVAESTSSSQRPSERPVVVCQGLADLDGGIAALRPEAQGALIEVARVHEGDQVQTGAVLVRLDDSAARMEVTAARANLPRRPGGTRPGRTAGSTAPQRASALAAPR